MRVFHAWRSKISVATLAAVLILAGAVLVACARQSQTSPALAQSISSSQSSKPEILRVSYIDVGQGDSILIQAPGGKSMLIDAGENDQGNRVVSYLKSQGVKRLDVVIWTHSHSDHIGGADVVTKNFAIGQVVMPKETSNTQTFRDLVNAIKAKGLEVTEAKAGVKIDMEPQIIARLVAPNSGSYEETNDYSAVLRLTYGKTVFLFTGDAEAMSEREMITSGVDLRADVLKIGHHGSGTSTSPEFLAKVQPRYAVISVGKDNSYGHPAGTVLTRLKKAGVQVYCTDEAGTIVAESDGTNITFATQR